MESYSIAKWHTLVRWTTIVWNIIQLEHGSKESIGYDTDFGYVCTVTSTLQICPYIKVKTSLG